MRARLDFVLTEKREFVGMKPLPHKFILEKKLDGDFNLSLYFDSEQEKIRGALITISRGGKIGCVSNESSAIQSGKSISLRAQTNLGEITGIRIEKIIEAETTPVDLFAPFLSQKTAD